MPFKVPILNVTSKYDFPVSCGLDLKWFSAKKKTKTKKKQPVSKKSMPARFITLSSFILEIFTVLALCNTDMHSFDKNIKFSHKSICQFIFEHNGVVSSVEKVCIDKVQVLILEKDSHDLNSTFE